MDLGKATQSLYNSIFGSTVEKRNARHKIVESVAARFGFRVYNPHLGWAMDSEFLEHSKGFIGFKGSIPERKFTLFYLAKSVRSVEGDTAECGVFRGESSYYIMSATKGQGRHHYGFDSFEGLSEPKAEDKDVRPETWKWKKNDLRVGDEVAIACLRDFEDYSLLKGWIPERFNEVADRKFSFLHIDVDLYQPTLDSLDYFYPRMSPGGIILCDDYGSMACPGAYQAMNEYFEGKPESPIHLTTGQGFIVKLPSDK